MLTAIELQLWLDSVLGKVSEAATHTRASADAVLDGLQAVEAAVFELRSEVEDFLRKVVA